MSAINKIPRGLRVLIVMAILAVLVWRFATGNYFYPGAGIAIGLTLIVIFIVYKSSRGVSNEGKSSKNNKAKTVKDEENANSQIFESEDMIIESQRIEDEITNSKQMHKSKHTTDFKSIEAKPKATDVTARYMNMAKTANDNRISDDWQPSPKTALSKDKISETFIIENQSDKSGEDVVESISGENTTEPPMPIIDDETSLTIEEKNQLVNAVWYRCENPFCKYTRFLGVHHIIEEKVGGTNKLDNLIVLCPYCHDLAHRKEIPENEMRDWISNREERFKFKPDWHHR